MRRPCAWSQAWTIDVLREREVQGAAFAHLSEDPKGGALDSGNVAVVGQRVRALPGRIMCVTGWHGGGTASNWAARAEPGHKVGILGPRGSHIVEDVFDWYLLIGDETVMPSIARHLAEAKAETTCVAFIEVNGPEDEQAFDTVATAEITWVHRNGAAPSTTTGLEEALRAFEAGGLPGGEVFVWAGGEAGILKGIRRFLLSEAGFDREWTSFSGHWKYGVADHDHHEPIED